MSQMSFNFKQTSGLHCQDVGLHVTCVNDNQRALNLQGFMFESTRINTYTNIKKKTKAEKLHTHITHFGIK